MNSKVPGSVGMKKLENPKASLVNQWHGPTAEAGHFALKI